MSEELDYGWIMQVTFIVTLAAGVPAVVVLSLLVDLATWGERAEFAIRTGAVIWLVTALAVFGYARRQA